MSSRFRSAISVVWLISMMSVLSGCAVDARPRKAPVPAGPERELIKPGEVGNKAAADRRRFFFDFWNEEVVRENVAVGTVFMGDSITELWEVDAYIAPSDGVIVNRGISGDLASVMARRFAADVVQLRPRNVVILAGTNDVSRMKEAGASDDEVIRSVVESITSMVDAARAAKIQVMVCSILPTNSDCKEHARKKACVPKINAMLKPMCEQRGAVYVDYGARLSDAAGDLPRTYARDGLHPHYAGYRIMADVLLDTASKHRLGL
jgi:lysophospholipase L1-like esterase